MKEIKVGGSGTEVFKGCKIAGLSFRFQLKKNAAYSGTTQNPFGSFRNGVPRVSLQHCKVKLDLWRGGKLYPLYNENLQDIACATTIGTCAYEYARHADILQIVDTDLALLPIRINFPSPLVLTGSDELRVSLTIGNEFANGCAATFQTLSSAVGSIDVLQSLGGTPFIDKSDNMTHCQIDKITASPDAVESATFYFKVHRPDANQNSINVSLGDNVTNVQFIHYKYGRMGDNIDFIENTRVIDTLTISGVGYTDTMDYKELLINKLSQSLDGGYSLSALRNHEVIYNNIASDLDNAQLEMSLIGERISSTNCCVFYTSFYSDLRMQAAAVSASQTLQEHKIQRLANANPKFAKLYKK